MANLEQFPSAALNGAYYDTPVAFEPQLPMGRPAGTNPFADSDTVVPPGAVLLEGGKLRLNFLAPTAAKVDAVLRYRERHDLEKGENGLWTAEIDAGDGGFIPILFHVDGVEVLNPLGAGGLWLLPAHQLRGRPPARGGFLPVQGRAPRHRHPGLLLRPVCRPAESCLSTPPPAT